MVELDGLLSFFPNDPLFFSLLIKAPPFRDGLTIWKLRHCPKARGQ
ncbi:unnamed protein product [Staurois parvus]|uniref:Uncharacterized protein n=1 Tax=Staurois parvus TaxID=386267 RepID=A0ABN9GDN6_9NEOB|nr:unnamed protein product [Staurois parvus]